MVKESSYDGVKGSQINAISLLTNEDVKDIKSVLRFVILCFRFLGPSALLSHTIQTQFNVYI